jgi:hypothetical protein
MQISVLSMTIIPLFGTGETIPSRWSMIVIVPVSATEPYQLMEPQFKFDCSHSAGVDAVDLDKCEVLWQAVDAVLKQMLTHKSWCKSACSRRPDEDVAMQAACHSCVCLWQSHQELINCSDQVLA